MLISVSLLSQLTTGTKPRETVGRIPEVSSAETPTLSPYQPSHPHSTRELMSEEDNANHFKRHISAGRRVAHLSAFWLFSDWKVRLAQQFSGRNLSLVFCWWPDLNDWSVFRCFDTHCCFKFATEFVVFCFFLRSAIRLQPVVWERSAN